MNVPYPAGLPKVTVNGYSIRRRPNIIRTEMESGFPRMRRRSTSVLTDVTVNWKLKLSEFAIFEKWYAEDLKDGVSWFEIVLFNGMGESTVVARFNGTPYDAKPEALGMYWNVSATIEVQSLPLLA